MLAVLNQTTMLYLCNFVTIFLIGNHYIHENHGFRFLHGWTLVTESNLLSRVALRRVTTSIAISSWISCVARYGSRLDQWEWPVASDLASEEGEVTTIDPAGGLVDPSSMCPHPWASTDQTALHPGRNGCRYWPRSLTLDQMAQVGRGLGSKI